MKCRRPIVMTPKAMSLLIESSSGVTEYVIGVMNVNDKSGDWLARRSRSVRQGKQTGPRETAGGDCSTAMGTHALRCLRKGRVV